MTCRNTLLFDMKKILFVFTIFCCFLIFPVAGQSVVINEVVASNKLGLKDDDGQYSDWIELYNTTGLTVSLKGWSITDDRTNPAKWIFPDVEILPRSYIVVFASENDRTTNKNYLHTNFKLNEKGEYLAVFDINGKKINEVAPFPFLLDDQSAGLFGGRWTVFKTPTPGSFNDHLSLSVLPSPNLSENHGVYENPFYLNISCPVDFASIYYTTDGSTPSRTNGQLYSTPLLIDKTTILRAIAVIPDNIGFEFADSRVLTRSFIFIESLFKQPNNPEGYPVNWGLYTYTSARAKADYEMDPELMSEALYKEKVKATMYDMPIVSIVTHRDFLFNGVADADSGGIYMFTAPPINGFETGRDWERPVSFEYINSSKNIYLQEDCGLQIHGGHSRLPEKSPKHSFRVDFQSEYGAPKLFFPLFGEGQASEINSFILRAGYGNTWLHMSDGERALAIYTRDAWAKRTQRKMGHFSTNTQYAHLFLNGIYWGVYNPNERVNDEYLSYYLGGNSKDFDVIKQDESGSGVSASDGTIDAWNLLQDLSAKAADNAVYNQIIDNSLLDIDNFIDYMLLNFYGANGDWDHHNWIAFRNRVDPGKGFRFLCWDSEHVLKNLGSNILNENNARCPSRIFQNLLKYPAFKTRVNQRIGISCFNKGALTSEVALETWQNLANEVDISLYAEAARWGDYRKDVHQYTSVGKLYRKEVQYDARAKYMREEYFPKRTDEFIKQLKDAGLFNGIIEDPTSVYNIYDEVKINFTNYPNPFYLSTTIEYNIKSVCNVNLIVYDLAGRKIDVLVNGNQEPGSYKFVYDTSGLMPGTYICRITLNGVASTEGVLRMIKL